jgi:hypothetical protein
MRVVKIKIPPKLDTVQWYTVGVGSWILAKSHYFWVSYISSLQFPLAGLRRKIKSGIKGGREGEIFSREIEIKWWWYLVELVMTWLDRIGEKEMNALLRPNQPKLILRHVVHLHPVSSSMMIGFLSRFHFPSIKYQIAWNEEAPSLEYHVWDEWVRVLCVPLLLAYQS